MTQINLLPWRELKREQEKKQFKIMLLGIIVVAAAIILLINYYAKTLVDGQTARNQRLRDEITLFDKQIEEIKKLKQVREALISRMTIVHNLQATRTLTVHLFDELVKVIPENIYLTSMERKENDVTVLGYSDTNAGVSDLMRQIEKSPWIQKPQLTEIKKYDKSKQDANRNEFKLSFTIKSGNQKAE